MGFNTVISSSGSDKVNTAVLNQIHVDGVFVKTTPMGTAPNVVYRIGDGTVHPEGWDNVLDNEYLDFYISYTSDSDFADISLVGINIVDIITVATTVVPNIAEILLADDNATTATTQAGIATTQATNASSSAIQAQLYEWEAEAERLTANSYATEVYGTFVTLVTSNGDGTFTYTPTTEYSAFHWASVSASNELNIDGGRADSVYTASQIISGGNA